MATRKDAALLAKAMASHVPRLTAAQRDTVSSLLAEGIHTAFRKASDDFSTADIAAAGRDGMRDDFSTADIAAALGRDSQFVRREIWRGRLPCARRIVRDGKVSYRVTLEELKAYMAAYDPVRIPKALEALQAA